MTLHIVGHAIVSADGRIADRNHQMPPELRSDADWTRFQTALDAAALVVLGRLGHETHPNPGRHRLVVTSRVDRLDRIDDLVTLWNPAGLDFTEVLRELSVTEGTVAVTGGQRVFDLFLQRFTQFDLVIVDRAMIPDGVPCFSTGWPDDVLARAGMKVTRTEMLELGVRLQVWR